MSIGLEQKELMHSLPWNKGGMPRLMAWQGEFLISKNRSASWFALHTSARLARFGSVAPNPRRTSSPDVRRGRSLSPKSKKSSCDDFFAERDIVLATAYFPRGGLAPSIISPALLNCRVRDGNGCDQCG